MLVLMIMSGSYQPVSVRGRIEKSLTKVSIPN